MARDLADELARREAELADRREAPTPGTPPGQGGDPKPGKGQGQGKGDGPAPAPGSQPGQGGWGGLTEAEQVERMAEMAKTLEDWLKQVDKRGEGKSAAAVREILDQGVVAEVVERTARMGELRASGPRNEMTKEARELAGRLEALGQTLELLHQGIVAPELAALVEFDRRMEALTARLATLKTEADVAAWKRDLATLIRDLDKARIAGTAELADALLQAGGGWHRDDDQVHLVGPDSVLNGVRVVSAQIKERVQEMILKDLASSRDETTPPAYRELVDRYYEVISRGAKAK